MTSMIERVARAIDPCAWDVMTHDDGCPDCRAAREQARGRARAAIEAMREPTEEMVRMGMTALPNSTPGRHQKTGWVWDAMIDAALKEQP